MLRHSSGSRLDGININFVSLWFLSNLIASTLPKDESDDGSLHFYNEMVVCKSKTFSLILAVMCFVIQLCLVWGEEGWRCWDGCCDHDIGGVVHMGMMSSIVLWAGQWAASPAYRPSIVLSELFVAQLQLSLNQDSITSLTLTLKGTRRFQTIFVQSALPCRLDFISERQIYKYLHRGPLSGRAQYLVSSYPHNIIALSSAQAQ